MTNTPAIKNPNDPVLQTITLCRDCAKHPSLKRFVEENAVEGPVCGICQETGYVYPACDPSRKEDLVNLIKALVRFYYNELEYNSHLGGDEPENLLVKPNPILQDQTSPGRTRSPDRSVDFLYDLFSTDPWPPEDKGIALYAGHDEHGFRHALHALKDQDSPILRTLRTRLEKENYFDIEPEVRTLVDRLLPRITRVVSAGTRYFRARIGIRKTFWNIWTQELVRQPFSGAALGAPPPQIASAGRLNRAGVSFLYLASDAATAASEVRPHPGHFLSIGEFESVSDLKIASFDADIMHFARNQHELELFHFVHSTGETMAQPVVPGNSWRYSVTQLIAECLRQMGFDGVSFNSSIAEGQNHQNLCVFKPGSFVEVDGSVIVREVKSLSYRLEKSPMTLEQGDGHQCIDGE